MASAFSTKLCEPCKEEKKETKARALCFECHELLCEECAKWHLKFKEHRNHNLIDLVPFYTKSPVNQSEASEESRSKSTSEDDNELASDFLEHVTLGEDTVLYRGAQVAVDTASSTSKTSTAEGPEEHTQSRKSEPKSLKATKCLEFSVKRPEDKEKVNVHGVLCLSDKVVVVDDDNYVLKLFDQNGTYLSSTELEDPTWGITSVRDSMFATCGLGKTVYIWTVRGQTIVSEDVSYHVDHDAFGIHYNGTYYCVLHRDDNAITILDRQGRQVRKIIMKEACGKKFEMQYDIHMDSDTNNIYAPCWDEDGVLCMTIDGQALWFTPLSAPKGITETQGTLCVVDYLKNCLHLMTKDGIYLKKLTEDLGADPEYVYYGRNGKFYVSFGQGSTKDDKIYVYALSS